MGGARSSTFLSAVEPAVPADWELGRRGVTDRAEIPLVRQETVPGGDLPKTDLHLSGELAKDRFAARNGKERHSIVRDLKRYLDELNEAMNVDLGAANLGVLLEDREALEHFSDVVFDSGTEPFGAFASPLGV